jgi:hypothetical protein
MKYLKQFNAEVEYASYKNGNDFITPNVSWVKETNSVKYSNDNLILEPLPDFETELYADNYLTEVGPWLYQEYEKMREKYNITSTTFYIMNGGYLSFNSNGEQIEIDIKHTALFRYLYSTIIDETWNNYDYIEFNIDFMKFYQDGWGAAMYWDRYYLYTSVDA